LESQTIIKLENISKSFGSLAVLDGLNLEIKSGRFYVLLGENGSGKSTIIKLLMGQEIPDEGQGEMLGHSIHGNDLRNRQYIGHVSELIDYKVPIKMKEFVLRYKDFFENWDQALFDKLIKDRKIDLNRKFDQYSRGQRMQLALILAISIHPKLLLLDEITSVLDIYARKYFLNLFAELMKKGTTILLTTNIISEVQQHATHIVLIRNQKTEFNSSIEQLHQTFVKLRVPEGANPNILTSENCTWAGLNSDGSTGWIVPKYIAEKEEIPTEFIDRRKASLDDIFIYYFNFPAAQSEE